jgi:hypothetical protein
MNGKTLILSAQLEIHYDRFVTVRYKALAGGL